MTSGEVLRCSPPDLLELSWTDDSWDVTTTVRLDLTADPGGSRLELLHDGRDGFRDKRHESLVFAHEEGWRYNLDNFRRYVARQTKPKPEPAQEKRGD